MRIELPVGLARDMPCVQVALADLESMRADEADTWRKLLEHCLGATTARPSSKWWKAADELIVAIGPEVVKEHLRRWLPLAELQRTELPRTHAWLAAPARRLIIPDAEADVLRGLCWIAAKREDAELASVLSSLATSCYRKLPGLGPRNVKVGNAAVYALGQMPGRASLAQLALLRVKVKFGTAQRFVAKALDAAAEREGLPRDEIEELAVPSYGLTDVGLLEEPLGEHTATLRITGTTGASATSLTWINAKGKAVKSPPAAVKRDHAEELKDLKGVCKDIQKMLPAQRDRIDGMFLQRRTWAYPTWRERYLDHPLVGTIARRLIWLFDDGREEVALAWLAEDPDGPPHGPGRLVRADGTPFEPNTDSVTVSLWHPIPAADPPGSTRTRDDILAWRTFYETREVRQPFKQAHREVYLLTDAERRTNVYSNRFAAHILRQHQFNALCSERYWRNKIRLCVDADYPPPSRNLPEWELRAEFWIESVGDYEPQYVLDNGTYRYVATDQVRFYRIEAAPRTTHAWGRGYVTRGEEAAENMPLPLDQIPPLVLSEVMRDVDLFVGVASVGNNTEWQDGGTTNEFREYWHSYSFGELSGTAQSRREYLKRLIPRLTIADACSITDRFLVVLGRKRTYKIHLGSGNILMEPDDRYLCIVPNRSMESGPNGQTVFLPFEGDRTLGIILSKAFMLVEDDKITDPTILSQINR